MRTTRRGLGLDRDLFVTSYKWPNSVTLNALGPRTASYPPSYGPPCIGAHRIVRHSAGLIVSAVLCSRTTPIATGVVWLLDWMSDAADCRIDVTAIWLTLPNIRKRSLSIVGVYIPILFISSRTLSQKRDRTLLHVARCFMDSGCPHPVLQPESMLSGPSACNINK